jgi:hypothetical protein
MEAKQTLISLVKVRCIDIEMYKYILKSEYKLLEKANIGEPGRIFYWAIINLAARPRRLTSDRIFYFHKYTR